MAVGSGGHSTSSLSAFKRWVPHSARFLTHLTAHTMLRCGVPRHVQEAADAKAETGRGEAATATAVARTPQKVIDTLFAARVR